MLVVNLGWRLMVTALTVSAPSLCSGPGARASRSGLSRPAKLAFGVRACRENRSCRNQGQEGFSLVPTKLWDENARGVDDSACVKLKNVKWCRPRAPGLQKWPGGAMPTPQRQARVGGRGCPADQAYSACVPFGGRHSTAALQPARA